MAHAVLSIGVSWHVVSFGKKVKEMEEKHIPNSEQPMKMQLTDPNKVICIDCAFRDKTTLELSGKVVPIGVTRCYCKIYPEKSSIGKPIPILICGADCEYYTKDEG